MAEKRTGKRSPTAHRTTAQMRAEGVNYGGRPEQKRNRAARNRARAADLRAGKVHKGDHLDVDHVHMLKDGGSTRMSNTRVVSRHKNRGWNKRSK